MDVPDCSAARKFLSEQIQNTGSKVICWGLIDDINNLTGLVGGANQPRRNVLVLRFLYLSFDLQMYIIS